MNHRPAGLCIGKVDADHAQGVSGWCIYPDEPARRVIVEAVVDGQVVAATTAARFRTDMRDLGRSDGFCGFTCEISSCLRDRLPSGARIDLREQRGGYVFARVVLGDERPHPAILQRLTAACAGLTRMEDDFLASALSLGGGLAGIFGLLGEILHDRARSPGRQPPSSWSAQGRMIGHRRLGSLARSSRRAGRAVVVSIVIITPVFGVTGAVVHELEREFGWTDLVELVFVPDVELGLAAVTLSSGRFSPRPPFRAASPSDLAHIARRCGGAMIGLIDWRDEPRNIAASRSAILTDLIIISEAERRHSMPGLDVDPAVTEVPVLRAVVAREHVLGDPVA